MNQFRDVWGVYDNWQRWALIALLVASVAQTAFVYIYAVFRPWWMDDVGRAILLKSGTLLVVLWLSLVNTFFAYNYQEPVSTIAIWAVALAIVYQLIVLVRTPARIHPDVAIESDEEGVHP